MVADLVCADQLNEAECFNIWCNVSDEGMRRRLEGYASYRIGSLGDDVPAAAREYHYFERICVLNTILELMKARMDDELIVSKREIIMAVTNHLLVENLPNKLLEALKKLLSKAGTPEGRAKFVFDAGEWLFQE